MGLFLTTDISSKFMINGVYKMPFKFLGSEVWLTDSMLTLMLVTIILLIVGVICHKILVDANEVPSGAQNVIEILVEFVNNLCVGNLGDNAYRFVNYFGTIFCFLLLSNLMGLLGLRAPSGDYGVTFALGMFTFFIIQFQGFKNSGIGNITGLFQPLPFLFPINLIGEIANPITLSLRLFANMLAGIIIMGLWYAMIPIFGKIGVPAFLHAYSDLFSGCIQAYVFCMLSSVYVSQKL